MVVLIIEKSLSSVPPTLTWPWGSFFFFFLEHLQTSHRYWTVLVVFNFQKFCIMILSILLCFLLFASYIINLLISYIQIFLEVPECFLFYHSLFSDCFKTLGKMLSPFYHQKKLGLPSMWPLNGKARILVSLLLSVFFPQAVLFLKVKRSPLCFFVFSSVLSPVLRIG